MGVIRMPSTRWMVRVLAVAVLCASLGAATTLAVAWYIALRGIDRGTPGMWSSLPVALAPARSNAATILYPERRGSGWSHFRTRSGSILFRTSRGVHLWDVKAKDNAPFAIVERCTDGRHPLTKKANTRSEYQFGWPFRAMWAAQDLDSTGHFMRNVRWVHLWRESDKESQSDPFNVSGTSSKSSQSEPRDRCLPTGVIATGFALDTFAFGSAWWLLLFGPRALVRGIRRWRGVCIRCGYSRAGLSKGSACPECGLHDVSPRSCAESRHSCAVCLLLRRASALGESR